MLTKAEARQRKTLTIDNLKDMEEEMLPPWIIAKVLGCNPYWVNLSAYNGTLPFPHVRSGAKGRTVKVSRRGFIAWAEGGIEK